MGKTIAKAVCAIAAIALVVAVIAVIYKYTNGFNEDFKTFYIQHNGENILSEKTKTTLTENTTERFDVRYTFDGNDGKAKDYSIKIVPNVTADFEFTAGDETYVFSKVKDLTSAFDIDKQPTYFEITLPNEFTLLKVLSNLHESEVALPDNAEATNVYPYTLIVSSYNGKVTYYIEFKVVEGDVTSVTLDPNNIAF